MFHFLSEEVSSIHHVEERALNQVKETEVNKAAAKVIDAPTCNCNSTKHRSRERRGNSPCSVMKPQAISKREVAYPAGNPFDSPKSNFILITTTNWEFADLADNWLEGLRRLGLRIPIILVCEDFKTYNYFKKRSHSEFRVLSANNFTLSKTLKQGENFQDLILKRTVYIRDEIKRGRDILLADVDAIWLQDPMFHITQVYDKYDIWIAQGKKDNLPCPCFMYLKSNPRVVEMTKKWVEQVHIDKKKTKKERSFHHVTDQWALHPLLFDGMEKGTLKVKWLEREYFPTGDQLLNETWYAEHKPGIAIAHGNNQGRHEGKIAFFKKFNLWFLK